MNIFVVCMLAKKFSYQGLGDGRWYLCFYGHSTLPHPCLLGGPKEGGNAT